MRGCTVCNEKRPLDQFTTTGTKRHSWCKPCRAEYARRHRRRDRLKIYGLTVEDYDRMLAEQGGGCAICGTPPGTRSHHVDHDHRTGEVRGLLCTNCNQGIGRLKDDPDLLIAAAMYLVASRDVVGELAAR